VQENTFRITRVFLDVIIYEVDERMSLQRRGVDVKVAEKGGGTVGSPEEEVRQVKLKKRLFFSRRKRAAKNSGEKKERRFKRRDAYRNKVRREANRTILQTVIGTKEAGRKKK